jgi:glycolate oxidase FAD binding subunit
MAVSALAVGEALAQIVGHEHVTGDPAALLRHAVDDVTPRWVVWPGSVKDVSELMRLARAEGLAVAPRGSGSSLGLGNPPRRLDLVLDLSRLSAVVDYVPEDLVATVEAGFPLGALNGRLAERDQMLALDPIGGASRTIGGILAGNASGPLRYRYGTGRDMLLGVRFVQADGTITWGGSRVVKSVTGYDVPKLLVGSLGTLGVIVEATLRLHPMPPASGAWLFVFDSSEETAGFVAALRGSSLEPDRVTLLNGEASRLCGHGDRGLTLLVSVGSVKEAVESQGAALGRLGTSHGATPRAVSASLWEALGEALSASIVLKLSCEPTRIVSWLGELERSASRLDLRASVVAQPGSGTLQCAIRGPLPGARAIDSQLLAPLRNGLAVEGGSLVVEHAPGSLKSDLDVWGPIGPEVFAIMSNLKREFDPGGVLNPGRFVGGL